MKRTILLVEDNPSDEKLTLLAFRDCGVENQVVVVRDGVEALEYLFAEGRYVHRDLALQPSVVLLDLKLPKLDGLDVLRRLRADERTKVLPVVVLSASREAEDVARCYDLGANGYVRKPVEFAAFVEAARTLGVFWLTLNEPAPPWSVS